MKKHIMKISKKYGAQEVDIPHMAKIDLYQKSGHAEKFKDELFKVISHYDEEFVLKPVNCPHHTQIYASKPRSYKDLPIAYVESTQQHRDEKPGAMVGLYRTRSFEVDDGHTFCTPEQLKNEVINIIKTIEEFYSSMGMWGNHWVSLSFKDSKSPQNYIGSEEDWQKAQSLILEVNQEFDLKGIIMEGEAALYGPKIDFMVKDAQGNNRQLGTIQIDFAMPKRFELTYTDKDGSEKTPVMLHRAILGSYHRFISSLLENSKGNLPLWICPTQVEILPVSEKFMDYGIKIHQNLLMYEIRSKISETNETLSNKIRKAQEQKIPYMVVVGQREVESQTLTIRKRGSNEQLIMTIPEFVELVNEKILSKTLTI
jgi:threonyl-tRNA synthetase